MPYFDTKLGKKIYTEEDKRKAKEERARIRGIHEREADRLALEAVKKVEALVAKREEKKPVKKVEDVVEDIQKRKGKTKAEVKAMKKKEEDEKEQRQKIQKVQQLEEYENEEGYDILDEGFEDRIKKEVKELGVPATLGNKEWRMDNLYKIRNKAGDIVVFKMNKVQRDYNVKRWYRNLIVKARQMGFSTYKVIDALDRTLFTPNSNNIIIAHTLPDAQKLFAKIELAWNNLPRFIKLMVYVKSKSTSVLEIGLDRRIGVALKQQPGKIVSSIAVATSGMGGTYSSVHITELGYLDAKYPEKASEIITGTIPAVPVKGDLDIESTARGNFGQFYTLVNQFKDKEPQSPKDFKVFFYDWRWDTEAIEDITDAQIEFLKSGEGDEWEKFLEYQEIHKLTDKELAYYYFCWTGLGRSWSRLRSEYPTTIEEAFSSDDEAIFPAYTLEKYETIPYKQVGHWKYYELPKPFNRYVLGCDPAEGVGKDNHAIVIMDITDKIPRLVATYTNNDISPTDLAYQVLSGCRMYNSCMACVERNNSGHATLGQLQQIYDVHRIYQEVQGGKATAPNRTRRLGWLTANHTKYRMVYDFKDLVDNMSIELHSLELIEELKMFTKQVIVSRMGTHTERLTVERKGDSHADLAIAAFICIQCINEARAISPVEGNGNEKRRKELELRKSFA